MKKSIAFAFLLCAALTGCATSSGRQELVNDSTPLAENIFNGVSHNQFESASFTSARATQLPYRLLRPSRLVPGQVYPLVVQLHGSGGIGSDNLAQLDGLAKSWAMTDVRERYQAFIVIPQFPIRSANYGPVSPERHAVPAPVLDDLVALIAEFSATNPVDQTRIYATGFSMGGSGTWLLPTIAPATFAAIVPIAGVAPPDSKTASFTNLPVLAVHGDADDANPITADKRFIAAIARHGDRQVWFRQYQGLGHSPPADMYPGFWWRDWLFGQRRK